MGVGVSRVAFQTRAKFSADQATPTELVTYFVDDHNPLPWATQYNPVPWDWPHPCAGLPDQFPFLQYYNGADIWHCAGEQPCGDEQVWKEGSTEETPDLVYDPDTLIPTCCTTTATSDIVLGCDCIPFGVKTYTLHMTDVVNLGCPDCTSLNGDWTLNYLSACTWRSAITGWNCSGFFSFSLFQLSCTKPSPGFPDGMYLRLFAPGGGPAVFWLCLPNDFAPAGRSTFTLVDFTPFYCTWPETVVIDASL